MKKQNVGPEGLSRIMGNQSIQIHEQEPSDSEHSAQITEKKRPSTERQAGVSPQFFGAAGSSVPHDIPLTSPKLLFLQRSVGNREVHRLLQAKLQIGHPGDPYEREADRVAEQILHASNLSGSSSTPDRIQPQVADEDEQRKRPEDRSLLRRQTGYTEASLQRQVSAANERRRRPEEEAQIQGESRESSTPTPGRSFEQDLTALQHGGEPLSDSQRSFFEPRFGADFSQVRIHRGAQAGSMARQAHARAFTTGQDIVFGDGEYAPDAPGGQQLLAHELTHVVQQSPNEIVLRHPDDGTNIDRLRELLEDDDEDEAIDLMGRLSADEVQAVLTSRGLKELAVDAFNDDEMYRAVRTMGGDVYYGLQWMFDEGTNWEKVRDILSRATTGKGRVRTDTWMREQFVSLCDDEEMAAAVDLLGGTLSWKLSWMRAEGSSWALVRARIQATTDAAQKTGLYSNATMREFFVDVCNDEQMAEAVDLLGGTLLQKLTWMRAEGSNWALVRTRIQATTDAAQKTSLYGNSDMKNFFIDICNNVEMKEAVDLLGFQLIQKLDWMIDEGTDGRLVCEVVTGAAQPQRDTVRTNARMMRRLRAALSEEAYARNRKRLGDLPPSGAALRGMAAVRAALQGAWNDSDVMNLANRHEEGGWIIWSWVDDSITVDRAPSGARGGLGTIVGTRPNDTDTRQVIGWFHTHPNPAGPDPHTGGNWNLGPSGGDIGFANGESLPGLVREYSPPGTVAGGATHDLNFGPAQAAVHPLPGGCNVEQEHRDAHGRRVDEV